MSEYTWILTPDLSGIDLDKLYEYSCYDDKCLISTFYIDEILDFLDEHAENKPKITYQCKEFTDKYSWKILLIMTDDIYEKVIERLILFHTGRFKTSSIYKKNNNEWIKIYKYNTKTNIVTYPLA